MNKNLLALGALTLSACSDASNKNENPAPQSPEIVYYLELPKNPLKETQAAINQSVQLLLLNDFYPTDSEFPVEDGQPEQCLNRVLYVENQFNQEKVEISHLICLSIQSPQTIPKIKMDSYILSNKTNNQEIAISNSFHPHGPVENPADLPLLTSRIMNCLSLELGKKCEDSAISTHIHDALQSSKSAKGKKTSTYL